MEFPWESELAKLLGDLLAVQGRLLGVIGRKRECLVAADAEGLGAIGQEEEELVAALKDCVARRETLLQRAREEGLPSRDIKTLAASLPRPARGRLDSEVREAQHRARLLRHESLTNWVVIQRTLLHLSQMIEIIATGGRLQPTYGEGALGSAPTNGALVDQAA